MLWSLLWLRLLALLMFVAVVGIVLCGAFCRGRSSFWADHSGYEKVCRSGKTTGVKIQHADGKHCNSGLQCGRLFCDEKVLYA